MIRIVCICLLLVAHLTNAQTPENKMKVIEIRSYNLKAGTRDEFHKLISEVTLPMLEKVNMKVVAHGPSSHDEDSYFLIRLFDGLEARQQEEDSFYGSDAWRKGPREKVLSYIESYTTVTLRADDKLIESLRKL